MYWKILPSAFNHDITSWTPVSLATRYSKKHYKVQVVAFGKDGQERIYATFDGLRRARYLIK